MELPCCRSRSGRSPRATSQESSLGRRSQPRRFPWCRKDCRRTTRGEKMHKSDSGAKKRSRSQGLEKSSRRRAFKERWYFPATWAELTGAAVHTIRSDTYWLRIRSACPSSSSSSPGEEFQEARSRASESDRLHGEFARQTGAPFALFRTPLLAPSGLPCNAPPWGTVEAVDLFTGKKVWD